jgi:hypothetical protein
MTRDKATEHSKSIVPARSVAPPPFNKAHSAVYALMSYELLTAIRKVGEVMGLTQEEIEDRKKAREAAENAEQQVDEAKAEDTKQDDAE